MASSPTNQFGFWTPSPDESSYANNSGASRRRFTGRNPPTDFTPLETLGMGNQPLTWQQLRQQQEEAQATAEQARSEPPEDELGLIDPDAARWAQRHFWVPELRGPIRLAPYQAVALNEALAVDFLDSPQHVSQLEDEFPWQFRYSTVVWSDIKKSIKSTIAAAVCLWKAFQTDWATVYTVANDLKQADSRVGYYIRRAIQLNPILRERCRVRNYKITLPNNSTIESIPLDPTGEAGSNADMIVFSELWGANSKTAERMWVEMTLSPTKFGKSFRWVETYAGYRDSSVLLWNLYEAAVLEGTRLTDDLEMFAAAEGRLFALWNTVPRLPWQTNDYYAQERAVFAAMPEEFERVHRNKWAEGSRSRYLDSITAWDACADVHLPRHTSRTPMILGLDAAVSGDTFAMVGVTRHPRLVDGVVIALARQWDPATAEDKFIKLDHKGKRELNFVAIEDEIRDVIKKNNVLVVGFDPYQLHHMANRLDDVVRVRKISQAGERAIADKSLLDTINNRHLAYDPESQEIKLVRKALDNADKKIDAKGALRIVKRDEKLKIDPAVALSMANYLEAELPARPPASEDDGISWGQQEY